MRKLYRIKKNSTDCLMIFWARLSSRIAYPKVAGPPRLSTSKTRTATNWIHNPSFLAIIGVQRSPTNLSCKLKTAAKCSNRTSRIATWLHPKTIVWICRLTFTSNRHRRANANPSKFTNRPKNGSQIRKSPTAASKIWHPFSKPMALSRDWATILKREWAPGNKPPKMWPTSCLRIRLPKCRKSSLIKHWNNRVRISKIRNSRLRSFPWKTSYRPIRIWISTNNFRLIKLTPTRANTAKNQRPKNQPSQRSTKSIDLPSSIRLPEMHRLRIWHKIASLNRQDWTSFLILHRFRLALIRTLSGNLAFITEREVRSLTT